MAKSFPYFKFVATEWLTGDIVYESFQVQGLFINLCALYWQRDGVLSVDDINKRYKNPPELAELSDRFISVNDGFISIKFLDEQLDDANHISQRNSKNGAKGGRPKTLAGKGNKPTANRPLTDRKAKKSKEEVNKNKNKNKNSEAQAPLSLPVDEKLKERKEVFKNELRQYADKYSKEMINDFYLYWIEPNKSRTRMRWEMQKTWDTNLRLIKWDSNNQKFSNSKTDEPVNGQSNYKAERELAEQRTKELSVG